MESCVRELPKERCGDVTRLTAALNALEALPVVNGLARCDEKHNNGAGRVIVNLWCRGCHEAKDKQPYIGLNRKPPEDGSAVPSYQVAAERLLSVVESKHAGCVEAAQLARAAAKRSTGSSSHGQQELSQDALASMMRLRSARESAVRANSIALAAEQAKDAAEAEVAALERALGKRQCTETVEGDGPLHATDEWDLADHRREMTRVMNRRGIEMGSDEKERELRTGKDGYLHHARTGLVGAVAYWAGGSVAVAVTMIVALIVHLEIVDLVRAQLPQSKADETAETEHEICNLLEQVWPMSMPPCTCKVPCRFSVAKGAGASTVGWVCHQDGRN